MGAVAAGQSAGQSAGRSVDPSSKPDVLNILAKSEKLNWPEIENLTPFTRIWVKARHSRYCYFVRATDAELVCEPDADRKADTDKSSEVIFPQAEVRGVYFAPRNLHDDSRGFLGLILGVGGGGGWDANGQNGFGGLKIGGAFTLDLQYDRIQGQNGFSTEGSAVIPLLRVPGWEPFSNRKFVKFYVEPGLGYRAGGGAFGGYSSAKVMAVLLDDSWSESYPSPYVEYERRFPFESPMQGDNRISFGVMLALCGECGSD